MKRFTSRFLPLCLVAGFFLHASPNDATAQRSSNTITRSVGLGAYVQNSHVDILIPIWVSPQLAIVPIVGAINVENNATQLDIGTVIRIYSKIARVSPYFGVRGLATVGIPSGGGGSTVDLQAGILFGGEFFLNNQFSFGIEAHGLATIPENGDRVITTATVLLANIYF